VLRQFKIVEQCQTMLKKGQEDPKEMASHLGVHSFFVPKIIKQSKNLTHKKVQDSMKLLCECDFKIKTGAGQFFEDFLVPYFSKAK
jgi:DNA polymerase III delta subunit